MAQINYIGDTDLLYILNKIKTVLDDYQKKDGNKVLSDNNFTNELLAKLNGIAAEADNVVATPIVTTGNKIATITINGTDVDIYSPKNSELVIDSAMSDTSENAVQNKTIKAYVDTAVGSVVGIKFETVASYEALPETGVPGTIYLVPNGGSSPNSKDEYVWVSSTERYEKIGTTDIDLSGYVKFTDLVEVKTDDIDTMFNTVFGA